MDEYRALLRHYLATLAYRTQKALHQAPEHFGSFCAAADLRTPAELVRHMSSVLSFALCRLREDEHRSLEPRADLAAEVERFHAVLGDLSDELTQSEAPRFEATQRLLQGPFADAMTHVGQLAMLRRLAGSPIPPESFYEAKIETENTGLDQPLSGVTRQRV